MTLLEKERNYLQFEKKKNMKGFKSNKKITYEKSIHYSVKIAEEIWQWLFSHIKNHQNRPLPVRLLGLFFSCLHFLQQFCVLHHLFKTVTQNEISICTTGRGWKYELARLCKKHRQSLIMWRKKDRTWFLINVIVQENIQIEKTK